VAKKVLDLLVFIAITIVVLGTEIDFSSMMSMNEDNTILFPLYFLPFLMATVIYIISFIFKIYKATTSNTTATIGLSMQILVKATQMLTYFLLLVYLKTIMPKQMHMDLETATTFYISIYHALNRNWHHPMAASLDYLVASAIL